VKKKTTRRYESSELLRKAYLSLKASDGLTLRGWAELCGVDCSALALIIHSKRLLPRKHVKKVGASLNFDELSQDHFERALERDWLKRNGIAPDSISREEDQAFDNLHNIIEGDAVLLKSWLHLALLESTSCSSFEQDENALAQRFGVPPLAIRTTLNDLLNSGYLLRDGDSLVKRNKKMRIPTKRSRQLIRNFHIQMLDRAKKHLQTATDSASFQRRLATGYTVAVNPKQLPKAKLILEKALVAAASALIKGSCTDVYQLQLQLFPLSARKNK
jgi:uncharacterized protein (TIGR02147 family)